MVRRPFTMDGAGAGYREDLEQTYPCGEGLISGRITSSKGQPIAVFTFSKPYSKDLGNAMVQLGAKVIGILPDGVRVNLKNSNQVILLLRLGTSSQKIAAARAFRDKVIDWVTLHPQGSDLERKRKQSGHPDSRDADHRQRIPAPQVSFRKR